MRTFPRIILGAVFLSSAFFNTSASDARDALVFYASFDTGADADLARGDDTLYFAPKMAFPPDASPGLPPGGAITRKPEGGVAGGCLQFDRKTAEIIFYRAKDNMPYSRSNWSGTVSFWLKLNPDEDLEPGYSDPIQITSKAWNNAAFFVEFSKDEKPREFRLGIYPDFEVWNPENRKWEDIPMLEKPLAPVIRPPFNRTTWTHVLFTFENFNTGRADGVANLYLNGEQRATLSARDQTFTWDMEKTLIMLGLSYIGEYDELAIFNRALQVEEVKAVFTTRSLQSWVRN